MQSSEGHMIEKLAQLPPLPAMLMRAVPTVVRSGKVPEDLTSIDKTFQLAALDPAHLQSYHQQFKGLVSDYPLTYFYLIAQRAHLAAMLDKQFPWPILGMVHVANTMKWKGQFDPQAETTLQVRIELPANAANRKRVRPAYHVEFFQHNQCILHCESMYQVGNGGKTPPNRRMRNEEVDLTGWTQLDIWQLDTASGRRYAKLSGDYNPIHLHPWLSRWFGFNQPIIHGMYSVARIQADIEHHFKAPVRSMEVVFKRPLALPCEAVSHLQLTESTQPRMMVTDAQGKKSYLEGLFSL